VSDSVRRSIAGLWARVKALEARMEAMEAAGLASGAAEAGGAPTSSPDGSTPVETVGGLVGRLRRPGPAADLKPVSGDTRSQTRAGHASPHPEPKERSGLDERSE